MKASTPSAVACAVAAALAVLVVAASVPAVAKKVPFTLNREAVLNGALLEPGEYRLELSESRSSVAFYREGRLIATSPVRVSEVDSGLPGDSVRLSPLPDGRQRIVRIVLSRKGLAIEFPEDRRAARGDSDGSREAGGRPR